MQNHLLNQKLCDEKKEANEYKEKYYNKLK